MIAKTAITTAAFLLTVAGYVSAQGAPAGTMGTCKDGTFTSSATSKGACGGHMGVAVWVGKKGFSATTTAVCSDGTLSMSKHQTGACAKHKGVKTWLKDVPK